ncbi:MAG: hypothetical protein PF693_18520 [Spirochaetia bacterium]|nr:hypothetical protein [Spirochaetia bacterium]
MDRNNRWKDKRKIAPLIRRSEYRTTSHYFFYHLSTIVYQKKLP